MRHAIRHLLSALAVLVIVTAPAALGQSTGPDDTSPIASQQTAPIANPTDVAAEKPTGEKPVEQKKAGEKKPEEKKPEEKKAVAIAATEKPETKKVDAEPATETVKVAPLKVDVNLRGTFEAETMSGVSVRLKEWKTLEVVKAAAHGARVRKGEVLVEFDTEDIDRAISDLRTDQELAALQFKQAEANMRFLESATPMDLAAAERSKQMADEDLLRFLEIERPISEKAEDFMLKMNENMLQYEEEELRQLEKMYKADDLTEETEEIILKRQRDTVERAKFSLQIAKILHERSLKVQLPREEESRKQSVRRKGFELARTKVSLPTALDQQKLDLEKLKVQQARSAERLKKLQADREAMKVVAPTDGVVYYGQFVRGSWTKATAAADDLIPGGDVSSGTVFMTIVQTRPVVIRADVAERDLHWVHSGLRGTVKATGYPDLKLSATVRQVDAFPTIGGDFEAVFAVDLDRSAEALVPGMNCTVKLVPYLNKQALTVPASALFSEELDDDAQYVYLLPKDGKKPAKRPVTAGQKSGDRVEIVKGLAAGDRVLLEKPKDEPTDK